MTFLVSGFSILSQTLLLYLSHSYLIKALIPLGAHLFASVETL